MSPPANKLSTISIVVCARNEEQRIRRCLESLINQGAGEIILIDGNSVDKTTDIASHLGIRIIYGEGLGLTRDRQLGVESVNGKFVFFVDADHVLESEQMKQLLDELELNDYDAIQSGLKIENNSFFCRGENDILDLFHNKPGLKKMIGVAPTLYRREIFEKINFDSRITSTIDDTDFFYRIEKETNFKVGIGSTLINQDHFISLKDYLLKFWWYGKGDAEFCFKHPSRAYSMFYHLLVRYPVIYSVKSLKAGRVQASIFAILQGTVRALAATYTITQLLKQRLTAKEDVDS